MPNTLAHFGIQAIASRAICRNAAPLWIFTGCVIPDVPWIFQRMIHAFGFALDWYNFRLYAIIQASLFCSLFLCGALALVSQHPRRVFLILTGNVVGHLLLDALQTKWGNGVHLLAPISWTLWNVGWFWPESLVTYFLTSLGLATILWMWRWSWNGPALTPRPTPKYLVASSTCMVSYLLLPFFFMQGPEAADNHFVHTLRAKEMRQGMPVEFDRITYKIEEDQGVVHTFGKETLRLNTKPLHHSGTLSIKGRFVNPNLLQVHEWHEHVTFFRDTASMFGLGFLTLMWLYSFLKMSKTKRDSLN